MHVLQHEEYLHRLRREKGGIMDFYTFIYNRFPRRFSRPEQTTVANIGELRRMITAYQGSMRVGCSIYDYTPEHMDVTLDRIVFDFDGDDRFEHVKKMHKKFRHVQHFIVFSGKGFHFYMFTKNFNNITDPVATLRNAYKSIEKEVGVLNDPSLTANAAAHMLAIPGSYNFRRQKWVVFVTEEDLNAGYDHILALAEQPPKGMVIYGQDLLDIGQYRTTRAPSAPVVIPSLAYLPKIDDTWLGQQPKPIQVMLTDPAQCNHRTRFIVAAWLKLQGYPREFVDAVAYHFYDKIPHEGTGTKYGRFKAKKVLESVYDKGITYRVPSMSRLETEFLK
jgi:hypothetical protein